MPFTEVEHGLLTELLHITQPVCPTSTLGVCRSDPHMISKTEPHDLWTFPAYPSKACPSSQKCSSNVRSWSGQSNNAFGCKAYRLSTPEFSRGGSPSILRRCMYTSYYTSFLAAADSQQLSLQPVCSIRGSFWEPAVQRVLLV